MISFKDLKKSFKENEVLKGIDLTIPRGEILFVLGTSGTGKSVLLKLIVGLLKPTSGEIKIEDQSIAELTEEELLPIRRKCGMVFQHPALFDSLSVFENIAFGIRRHLKLSEDEIEKKVEESLRLVHLKDIQNKYPQQISYGMQKRVSLARTVAVGPDILLFDEPTTGLDPVTTSAINQLIKELSRSLKTTSVVVSHDMGCALSIADRIIVLDKGQIIEQGTPDQIRTSKQALVQDFMAEVSAL